MSLPGRLWREHRMALVTLLMGFLFLVGVQWQIVTYVCGNDPTVYIRSARILLNPSLYGPAVLRKAMLSVAPGYPILLSIGIKLFGSLSPYWINLGFLSLTLPLMWRVFRSLMGSGRAAAFSLLGLLIIAFGSHELFAPFLLYPFREASRVFFVYLAYIGVMEGIRRCRGLWGWMLAASVALLMACAIREPSALVLPGLLLGILGLPAAWRVRVRAIGWFLLPWLVVGIAAVWVLSRVALVNISQFSVIQYLSNPDVAIVRGKEMLGWFPERVGWLAVVLMLVGMLRAVRRAPVLYAWFLLPGVLIFVFTAYMQVHVRYFLSSLLFLGVFAGYGLDGLCKGLEWGVSRVRSTPWFPAVVTCACMGLLAMGLFHVARHVEVWGPEMRAADIRQWQAAASQWTPSGDGRIRVAVEQRCRYLEDLLQAYTDAELLDPREVGDWPTQWSPLRYFMPLNRQAFYAAPQWLMWRRMLGHRILEDRMDLIPMGGASPLIRTIGRGQYAEYEVREWTPGVHVQEFSVTAGVDQVLWLDWGRCPTGIVRHVEIRNAETDAIWISHTMTGNGLQVVFLPAATANGARGVMHITAPDPVPARPLFAVTDLQQPMVFEFYEDRRLSQRRTLLGLDDDGREEYAFPIEMARGTAFTAPATYVEGTWEVAFAGSVDGAGDCYLRCRYPDGPVQLQELSVARGNVSFGLRAGMVVQLDIVPSRLPAQGVYYVECVSFRFRPGS